jgi:Initiator Replication protein
MDDPTDIPPPKSGSPQRRGDPFDLSTDPTVPKALGAIHASEQAGNLTATDKKLINWLLAVAYPDLLTKEEHSVSLAEVKNFLGSEHESNDRVRASFSRLSKVALDFDIFGDDKRARDKMGGSGEGEWVACSLLWARGSKDGSGHVTFGFPPPLRPLLATPAMYARLRLAVIGQFRSKYAITLYELLEVYSNRESPVWHAAVEDLRALMGVRNKMPNFKDFRSRVLDPAVSEINDKSDITVEVTEVKDGRRVGKIIFRVHKKDAREAFEAELRHKAVKDRPKKVRGKSSRDTATADLLDGRTDRERGGPPRLKAPTIEEARRRFPGWDMDVKEREWSAAQDGREPLRDPDRAFLAWLGRVLAGRTLA